MPKVQKSRTPRTSKGENGAGGKLRQPLSPVQKVLLGGGQLRTIKSVINQKPSKEEPVKQTPAREFLKSIKAV